MNGELVERLREPTFTVTLFVGMLVFAFGIAFLILGWTVNTAKPAPYVSSSDRYLLIGISIVAIVVGGGLVRFAGKVVGW